MGELRQDDRGHNGSSRISAVVLAAGSASRMGYRPKCLLELDGTTLLRRQLTALYAAGVQEVVLVLGHYAERILQSVQEMPFKLVLNPDPKAEQVTSLRWGLQALSDSENPVLVALADQPLILAQDLCELIAIYQNRPQGIHVVQPHVQGLPGNPVMFSSAVRAQILAGPPEMGCRQWQARHPAQVLAWNTCNMHYRLDVDSEDDLAALALLTGQRLVWPTDFSV